VDEEEEEEDVKEPGVESVVRLSQMFSECSLKVWFCVEGFEKA